MWTYERVATLRNLWAEGLSASQCANRLRSGYWPTRSAVIGKVWRLGLGGRERTSGPNPNKVKGARTRAATIAFVPNKVIRPTKTETLSAERQLAQALPMLGETVGGCEFIAGDPAIDATKCGRAKLHGPYCSQHIKLCYAPSKPKARPTTSPEDRERRRWLKQLSTEARA